MFDLKRLEYPKVLRLLADFCVSAYSKERVRRITPTGNGEEIEQLFGTILELRQAFQDDCIFTQPAFHSVGDCLSRAAAQHSSLNIEDFVHIHENLRAAATLKKQCEKYSDEVPLFLARIKGDIVPTDLQEAIDRTIDSRGTIRRMRVPASKRYTPI